MCVEVCEDGLDRGVALQPGHQRPQALVNQPDTVRTAYAEQMNK